MAPQEQQPQPQDADDISSVSSVGVDEMDKDDVQDILKGVMYATLAITDDKPDTLKNVGKSNPWHVQAIRLITGSVEGAHKPLTEILQDHMALTTVDTIIDESGVTKGGHFIDTQGYIAHNDKVIVLSYRCTTSAFDWLANFNTTSSAWELEEDLAQGYSGCCSGFDDGVLCSPFWKQDGNKPRVHTGFYNNFLASLPHIKQHIEPLLQADQPPRKLYVVGHSLGAGIATLASCYFLQEYEWETLPHQFVNVTAGSPRACCTSMAKSFNTRMDELRRHDASSQTKQTTARIYRVVNGKDMVVNVPPSAFGFCHLTNPITLHYDKELGLGATINNQDICTRGRHLNEVEYDYDDEHGATINFANVNAGPEDDDKEADDSAENPMETFRESQKSLSEEADTMASDQPKVRSQKYDSYVAKIPTAFRDHMPDFYLKPLFVLNDVPLFESVVPPSETENPDEKVDAQQKSTKASKSTRKKRRFFRFFSKRKQIHCQE